MGISDRHFVTGHLNWVAIWGCVAYIIGGGEWSRIVMRLP